MEDVVKIKYVSEEIIGRKKVTKTQELSLGYGLSKIGPTWFNIKKISPNHITICIAQEKDIPEENQNKKSKFLKTRELFGKNFIIPIRSYNLNIGNWLDFTDGFTETKHTIYINTILCSRG